MENMQNVTAALNALGVKTCLACGKAGAKSLCMGCKTVYFCGKACQKEAWPGHKKECRRIVRERARVLDKAAADYAADEGLRGQGWLEAQETFDYLARKQSAFEGLINRSRHMMATLIKADRLGVTS